MKRNVINKTGKYDADYDIISKFTVSQSYIFITEIIYLLKIMKRQYHLKVYASSDAFE